VVEATGFSAQSLSPDPFDFPHSSEIPSDRIFGKDDLATGLQLSCPRRSLPALVAQQPPPPKTVPMEFTVRTGNWTCPRFLPTAEMSAGR